MLGMGKKWIIFGFMMLYDENGYVRDFIMYRTMDVTAQHISLSYDILWYEKGKGMKLLCI